MSLELAIRRPALENLRMARQAANSESLAPRPWYRLHLSTWLLLVLGIGGAVLIIVPGEAIPAPDPPLNGWLAAEQATDDPFSSLPIPAGTLQVSAPGVAAIVHGWPFQYLRRSPYFVWPDPQASSSVPWELTQSVDEFRIGVLILDIGLVSSGLLILVGLAEWRRRRRRRSQFTLLDLLGLTTLTALVLGWWGMQHRIDGEFQSHLAASEGRIHIEGETSTPRSPLWLQVLVHDDRLLKAGINEPGMMRVVWSQSPNVDVQYVVEYFPNRIDSVCVSDRAVGLYHLGSNWQTSNPSFQLLDWKWPSVLGADANPLNRDGLSRLSAISNLRSIWIADASRIDDECLAELCTHKNLEGIDLEGAVVTAKGLSNLADLKRLRLLGLQSSSIEDDNVPQLANIKTLEELDLSQTWITDRGLDSLRALSALKYVDLRQTAVTDAGVATLKSALPKLTVHYESERPDLDKLAYDFGQVINHVSRTLNVSGWKIGDAELAGLGKLTNLGYLNLNAPRVTDETLARVRSLTELQSLDIAESQISPAGLRHLEGMAHLYCLTLCERQIGDQSLEVFKQLPHLRYLQIRQVGRQGVADRFKDKLQRAMPKCEIQQFVTWKSH